MYRRIGLLAASSAVMLQWGATASAQDAQTAPKEEGPAVVETQPAAAAPQKENGTTVIEITGQVLGKGEARANSVIDKETILQQPAGLDPLKLLTRVPGLQVGSSDALTGS